MRTQCVLPLLYTPETLVDMVTSGTPIIHISRGHAVSLLTASFATASAHLPYAGTYFTCDGEPQKRKSLKILIHDIVEGFAKI